MSLFTEITDILDCICGLSKLERDRAEISLIEKIKTCSQYSIILDWIDNQFKKEKTLERSIGCLTVFKLLLIHSKSLPEDYLRRFSLKCIEYHQHDEYRVRILAGECMGELCRIQSKDQYLLFIVDIKKGIIENNIDYDSNISTALINKKMMWQYLETWLKCLKFIILGLKQPMDNLVDQETLEAIFETANHLNRFVRESGFELIGTIAEKNGFFNNKNNYFQACQHLAMGLSDNWSEVRMSSSIATRKLFLSSRPNDIVERDVFRILLPRICLNRYYIAEGVKLYNHDTWRLVVGDHGRELIEENIDETVEFYIEQTEADNHGVREAACSSISELALKLNRDKVVVHLTRLLDALVKCFQDRSWPVRDLACVACGHLVAKFTRESGEYREDYLMPLFLGNVVDNIFSVREGGAYSVASVIGALKDDKLSYLKDVLNFIYENLENVKNQNVESGSTFRREGCSSDNFDNQLDSQQCKEDEINNKNIESLVASQIIKGIDEYGCRDKSFSRHSELWERADGCVHLIGELSLQVPQSHQHMTQLISVIIKAISYRHYHNHVYFLATVCNNIVKIYDGLGKQSFKHYLNDFLSVIDVSISSNSQFSVRAAEDSLRYLSGKLGHNILRGRIEMYSPDLWEKTKDLF